MINLLPNGRHLMSPVIITIMKQNWNQFLFVAKATALKQQISLFYPQIQCTDDSDDICVRQWPAKNVKATHSFCV